MTSCAPGSTSESERPGSTEGLSLPSTSFPAQCSTVPSVSLLTCCPSPWLPPGLGLLSHFPSPTRKDIGALISFSEPPPSPPSLPSKVCLSWKRTPGSCCCRPALCVPSLSLQLCQVGYLLSNFIKTLKETKTVWLIGKCVSRVGSACPLEGSVGCGGQGSRHAIPITCCCCWDPMCLISFLQLLGTPLAAKVTRVPPLSQNYHDADIVAFSHCALLSSSPNLGDTQAWPCPPTQCLRLSLASFQDWPCSLPKFPPFCGTLTLPPHIPTPSTRLPSLPSSRLHLPQSHMSF